MDINTFQTIRSEQDFMMTKFLTIAIPTFNRSEHLKLLLHTLSVELIGQEKYVEIVISDNASTDGTNDVVQQFKKILPSVRTIRHAKNVGMDENFCHCFEMASGQFFWMLGDDDLPKSGVLQRIIHLLRNKSPDLLYLNSEWKEHLISATDGESVAQLSVRPLERLAFANQVNVWLTYISGMVVNRQRLQVLEPQLQLRRYAGSNLVQLGWILPLLMKGNRFSIVKERCILATSGNTGGYKLFTVFGANLRSILVSECGSSSAELQAVMKHVVWFYIPKLIWAARFGNAGTFIVEDVLVSLSLFRRSLAYWLIIFPLATLPQSLAFPFLLLAKSYALQHRIRNLNILGI